MLGSPRHTGLVHRIATGLLALTLITTAAACGSGGTRDAAAASPTPSPSATSTPAPSFTSPSTSPSPSSSVSPPEAPSATPTPTPPRRLPPSGRPVIGTGPPPWLGTRVLPRTSTGLGEVRPTPPELVQRRFTLPDTVAALPGSGFDSRVSTPAPGEVIARSTWRPGCPVAARDLSWVRLTFWGFDGRRHTGELLVNSSVATDLVGVFRRLYAARFPFEEMRITRRDELDAPPTGDGNDTGVFSCRATVGATSYSQHAYGLAVDLDPFQNPYVKGDVVLPELASSYLDRSWVRPGMITAGGPVVRAFRAIGWTWGGTWHSLKDLQHFSANGR